MRSTFWALTPDEQTDRREEIEDLLKSIDNKIGDRRSDEEVAEVQGDDQLPRLELFGDWNDTNEDDEDGNDLRRSDADEYTPEAFDQYLPAEIVADRGGDLLRGAVKSRKRDCDGKPVGSSNPNPLLDTREYLVCFELGTEETYTANLIAESLYSQIDDEGRRLQSMQEIVDHLKDDSALQVGDAYYSTKTGPKPKRTTKGWRLLVEWKDGSSSWIPLKDLKDAYPVQVADYAVANNLTLEPAFRWWVPFVLKKRECILQKVKTKYWSTSHKPQVRAGTPKECKPCIGDGQENGNGLLEKGN